MEALRLIKTARHALSQARTVPDVLTEAWQAGTLTELIGARIAETESGEVGALGQLLCEAGAHAVSSVEQPATSGGTAEESDWQRAEWSGAGRAGRLTELGELVPALEELERLLHDVADSLVVLACGAEGESLYWCCIDGVDAGAECKDLVADLLQTVRKERGDEAGPTAVEAGEAEAAEWADEFDESVALERSSEGAGAGSGVGRSGRGGAGFSGTDRERPGPGRSRPGPAVEQDTEEEVPLLLVPLSPPVTGRGYQPVAERPVESSAAMRSSAARAPDDCRSASSPARSALTELSSSCICSSRLLGAAGVAGRTCGADSRGAAGVSDQGSDMRGPLQLGSAV
ncbi:DUF6099 family protein [Kitasatospora sp. NPDC002227]|uniref:DUF6099 family protein n=1 Tax=Kitasatospora sp. NPDC002227 TaxID=3154773 RepID=UPI003331F4EA